MARIVLIHSNETFGNKESCSEGTDYTVSTGGGHSQEANRSFFISLLGTQNKFVLKDWITLRATGVGVLSGYTAVLRGSKWQHCGFSGP